MHFSIFFNYQSSLVSIMPNDISPWLNDEIKRRPQCYAPDNLYMHVHLYRLILIHTDVLLYNEEPAHSFVFLVKRKQGKVIRRLYACLHKFMT